MGCPLPAILANAMDCARAIGQGLKTYGVDLGPILYVENARVGARGLCGRSHRLPRWCAFWWESGQAL